MSDKSSDLERKEQAVEESAVNKKATDGKDINHQVKEKKEQHQPRDNA